MNGKIKKLISQIIKYLSSGFLGVITDIILFSILVKFFLINVLIANTVATITATTLNFGIQKIWTFQSKSPLTSSFTRYMAVWLFNYCFSMGYIFLTVELLGWESVLMKISTYIFITIWNYFLYKNYVYKHI